MSTDPAAGDEGGVFVGHLTLVDFLKASGDGFALV
jgi:hypothetical protein